MLGATGGNVSSGLTGEVLERAVRKSGELRTDERMEKVKIRAAGKMETELMHGLMEEVGHRRGEKVERQKEKKVGLLQ